MIEVKKALSIIEESSCKMPIIKIKVVKSLGYILAEAVYSPINMPPFRQSAMDGYAFSYSELKQFNVISTSQAGDYSNIEPSKNEAIRIFTGAFVPDNLDTVVMQEHTLRQEKSFEIIQMPLQFSNVRSKGEQIKKNELVLEKNTLLTPASLGFLSCLGITSILVYDKPKVAILITGDELVKPGKKLPQGKMYESNSIMLKSALNGIGINKIKTFKVKDNLKATKRVIKDCLIDFDVVLVSGGISVGDYDFVKEALLANDVEELFYKINQKPGKPLFFGKKGSTIIFALPGNPASSLTSFYIYVHPALKIGMGFETIHLGQIKRKISTSFENTTGKTLFLKSIFDDEKVTILESQNSAMLNTFALANSLICLPFDIVKYEKDQVVVVIPIR